MMLLPSCIGGLLSWAFLLLLLWSSEVHGDCGRPNMPNTVTLRSGTVKDSYPVGTVLQYRCIPGYENIPGATSSIQCQGDSTWTRPPPFCRKRKCRAPHIENGRIISTGDLELGEEITFACDIGYRLIGEKKSRCVVSGAVVDWNREAPYCQPILCFPPPKIANGGHTGDDRDEYTHGTAVTYKCNAGFSLIGSASIACTTAKNGVDGEWSPAAPECKDVKCKRPIIQNGRVGSVFQATYAYDNTIMIVCDAGHTLIGSAYIKCGADNSWLPAVPTCAKGVFTTTTTTTTRGVVKKNETVGPPTRPPIKPTTRPTTGSTEETGPPTQPPIKPTTRPTTGSTEETGSTQSPDETDLKDKPGTSKNLGIAIGAVVAVIFTIAVAIFIAMKYKERLQRGAPEELQS